MTAYVKGVILLFWALAVVRAMCHPRALAQGGWANASAKERGCGGADGDHL